MKSKTVVIIVSVIVGLVLLTSTFISGFVAGHMLQGATGKQLSLLYRDMRGVPEETITKTSDVAGTPEDLQELFVPFWQAWEIVKEEYVDQPVDEEEMMRGAISGMLESLDDPHTSYLDPEMYQRANAHLEGEEYEGIGAWVDISGDFLIIISPMPGSPAEKAGLQPGDTVIAIDGEDMTGVDGEIVRKKILGPEGSTVTLTILREGEEEPMDIQIQRASIVVPTVESKMLDEHNIAYVRLYTFGDKTEDDLRNALKELLKQKPDGLILDLRYNGGGYLNTAISVASEFIGEGVIMYEEYGDGSRVTFEAKKGGLATDIPMVVLINEGSASASEIVAGAIQDRERGLLVGVVSYGKGSVQTYTELKNDEGAIRVTIARWLTPNGRQIMGIGLTPDYIVEYPEEDYKAGVDPQLDKAIELLENGTQ